MTNYDFLKRLNQSQYQRQLERIKQQNKSTKSIEKTIDTAINNIFNKDTPTNSFVIYGEPQSGKTEMMICLASKLLDSGFEKIIILVNDSIDLLNQNMNRFKSAHLSPAPLSLSEFLSSSVSHKNSQFIVFSKKNSKDLEKLLKYLSGTSKIVVIDDEADFATPNSKINKGDESKINSLVKRLANFGNQGLYIGVTATPARLDLNNALDNERSAWVHFPAHEEYCGNDVFFPLSKNEGLPYRLIGLSDSHDNPKPLRDAISSFLISVAHLNSDKSTFNQKNYVMIIHTSGKTIDHKKDKEIVEKYFDEISDINNPNFNRRFAELEQICKERFPNSNTNQILQYIYDNRKIKTICIINSTADRDLDVIEAATTPKTPFTIAIGGNIISRGVTFNNLLSMYFTRTAKKFQQDTYIQRARMFGSRKEYLSYFELHIPITLYLDWVDSFEFHRLALATIQSGKPQWLENSRIRSIAPSSVDKANVNSWKNGGFPFSLIDFTENLKNLTIDSFSGLNHFDKVILNLPKNYEGIEIINFLRERIKNSNGEVVWHKSRSFMGYADGDYENIVRTKGGLMDIEGDLEPKKFPDAIFHFKLFYNDRGKARIYYRNTSKKSMVKFISWRNK